MWHNLKKYFFIRYKSMHSQIVNKKDKFSDILTLVYIFDNISLPEITRTGDSACF